jgi:hypothetical protein
LSQAPDPRACQGPEDVGRLEHDEENDIWYECSYDPRENTYTWMIILPVDSQIAVTLLATSDAIIRRTLPPESSIAGRVVAVDLSAEMA